MNRWLGVVAAFGLVIGGCAAGVDDPQPAPLPDPVAKEPPAQTFSGEVPANPYEVGVAHSIAGKAPVGDIPILPSRPTPSNPDGNNAD